MNRTARLLIALVVGFVLGAALLASLRIGDWFDRGPDAETVASASLQSVREQARLTVFAARFVAVVTSSQQRFGLTAQKTLIMPGLVRYEVDLAKLQARDLSWDAATNTLSITMPPIEISQPQVNLAELREYGEGGVLMALTDAERALDTANRRRGIGELVRQARDPLPMRLAREAARRAVERSFAMPMQAAGIDATVVARFAGEGDPSYLDRSRRVEDVLNETAGK